MTKRICLFALLPLLLLFSGCHSSHSLDRTPQTEKRTARKKSAPRKKTERRSDDPLFDKIFHRNPQKLDSESKLSRREQELMREYDVRKDRTVRELHEKNRKSNAAGSDWVFGTKNGSYF